MVDGAYIICKLAILTWLSFKARRAAAAKAEAEADELERRASGGPLPGTTPSPGQSEEGLKGKAAIEDDDDEEGEHRLLGGETERERTLRRRVFLSGAIPWCGAGLAGRRCAEPWPRCKLRMDCQTVARMGFAQARLSGRTDDKCCQPEPCLAQAQQHGATSGAGAPTAQHSVLGSCAVPTLAGGSPPPATCACWRWLWAPYPSSTRRPSGTKCWWRGEPCRGGPGQVGGQSLQHQHGGADPVVRPGEQTASCESAHGANDVTSCTLVLARCSLVAPPLAFANGYGAGVRATAGRGAAFRARQACMAC